MTMRRAEPDQEQCRDLSPHGSPCGRHAGHSGKHAAYSPRPGSVILEKWDTEGEDEALYDEFSRMAARGTNSR